MNPLQDKNIILGVTGSIAAYKAVDLASKLSQKGAKVETILTRAATEFIRPISFQSVTGRRAYCESDLWGAEAHVLHIGLARKADLLVIAPASANTLAKLANGIADNLLSVTALALHRDHAPAPMLLAPAMDAGMYGHLATQENLQILEQRGSDFIGPEEGHLASGLIARGRMSEPGDILGKIRFLLSRNGAWGEKRIIVTAGGTQEDIDPVRFITNRSSGKQGYALAQASLDAGADVTLITAPTSLSIPTGVNRVAVRNASEMKAAVLNACQGAHALIMAAAVADYRPSNPSHQKIKKETGTPTLILERTSDILATVKSHREHTGFPKVVVGFAAETQNMLENAQAKLQSKGLDLIILNDVSATDAGFGVDTNRVSILWANGKREDLPLMKKEEIASALVDKLVKLQC
jgi:phosphopantothenoylcysteine decarboxylase/phosphopantothenate--cysteine ligase